jgi:hypothetical protein
MKTKLNLYERIKVGDFLPAKGGLEIATVAADIKKKLEIKQDEIEKYEIKSVQLGNGRFSQSWNDKGKEEKAFDFTKLEVEMIKNGLEDMNKKGEIPSDPTYLDLCRKIKAWEYKDEK